jgi:glycosyltransferase involved in cell wall biosynthesis
LPEGSSQLDIEDFGTAHRVVAIFRTQILPRSETFVRDQALALRRWQPYLIGERKIDDLPLHALQVASMYKGRQRILQKLQGASWRWLDRAPPGITKLARRIGPNLIHAHFGFDGVEAWPVAKALGVPLLVTLHGSDITTTMDWFAAGRAGRRWQSYPARLARLAQQQGVTFVAVSENIRRAALDAGLPDSKIFLRYIGVDTAQFAPVGLPVGQRPPVIVFLGRLVEKKGATYLLDAFEIVRQLLPKAELVIAGDGPEAAALAARAVGIGGVRMAGAFNPEQARGWLATARVLCAPSITARSGDAEGLQIVILEAQASGVPVVTSARGGATEGIIDGKTGFAFAERDVEALAAHLVRLLTDDALAQAFSTAATSFAAQKFEIGRCTEALETLYDQAAGFCA